MVHDVVCLKYDNYDNCDNRKAIRIQDTKAYVIPPQPSQVAGENNNLCKTCFNFNKNVLITKSNAAKVIFFFLSSKYFHKKHSYDENSTLELAFA